MPSRKAVYAQGRSFHSQHVVPRSKIMKYETFIDMVVGVQTIIIRSAENIAVDLQTGLTKEIGRGLILCETVVEILVEVEEEVLQIFGEVEFCFTFLVGVLGNFGRSFDFFFRVRSKAQIILV